MLHLRTSLLTFIFLQLQLLCSAQTSSHTLIVNNLGKINGRLYIAWYDNAVDFTKPDKAVYSQIVEVGGKDAVVVKFENVVPGTYAVAIFLDKNQNGRIDTNVFGIPKEKYGFSNNVYPLTRAATFKESAFTVTTAPGTQTIRLK